MATVCPDNPHGLCSECKDLKPYWSFRINPDCQKSGAEDKCCGYFYAAGCPNEELIGKKMKFMEPISRTNVGRKVLFQFHSALPVYEGEIVKEHHSVVGINRSGTFYTVRRRSTPEEQTIIASLSKSKFIELPVSLRFGTPVITREDPITQWDHWIGDEEVLSFVESENGETVYELKV